MTQEHGTPYRAAEGPTALELAAEGPVLRVTSGEYRMQRVHPVVFTLLVLVVLAASWALFDAEYWPYGADLYAAWIGSILLIARGDPNKRFVAAIRHKIGALPFPVEGLDDWLDPAGPGFGAFDIVLRQYHPLLERAVFRFVPVRWLGWSSETTLEVRVAWTGGHEDLFAFAELLREVLATHCGELGVERVICRPPELTHPDATVRTGA